MRLFYNSYPILEKLNYIHLIIRKHNKTLVHVKHQKLMNYDIIQEIKLIMTGCYDIKCLHNYHHIFYYLLN